MNKPQVTPEEIAAFRRGFRTVLLATSDMDGEPLCSYAPFVDDDEGHIYVFVSRLARHTANLLDRGRAHLMFIEDEKESANPFARRRLTLRCDTRVVPRDTESGSSVLTRFGDRFGRFFSTLRALPDFVLVQLTPRSGDYVKGFGQAFALGGNELGEILHRGPSPRQAVETSPGDIIGFWFSGTARKHWFNTTGAFDQEIRERFLKTWHAAERGELSQWESSAEGALALAIVLDQFPLNMFRDRPEAFSTEAAAREVSTRAIDNGLDRELDEEQKGFLYIPFMHSEDLSDQDRCIALYRREGMTKSLEWARHHHEIVRRFGRFPHRNAILGRKSTDEEATYLNASGAFRG
ncbi:MAG: DUF924 family protein [Pseudomonadota bacterium]|nr:DUF924 family protein [Pseudomonadota bacterium]